VQACIAQRSVTNHASTLRFLVGARAAAADASDVTAAARCMLQMQATLINHSARPPARHRQHSTASANRLGHFLHSQHSADTVVRRFVCSPMSKRTTRIPDERGVGGVGGTCVRRCSRVAVEQMLKHAGIRRKCRSHVLNCGIAVVGSMNCVQLCRCLIFKCISTLKRIWLAAWRSG